MRKFKINEKIEVVCEHKNTRSGFKHIAYLLFDGVEQEEVKVCYQNRTWERYEFQSVLNKLVDKSGCLSEDEKKVCQDFIEGDQTDWSSFKSTGMIAQLGEVFCNSQKEKNDWKTKMLKAGLVNSGLSIPEDWDNLDENEKESRLNKVIELTSSVGGN